MTIDFAAFVDNVWSFILTLVRSLLALFSVRRRTDPSTVHRVPDGTLVRVQSHLRPILLTPRSVTRSPAHYLHHFQSTRSPTLFPPHNGSATHQASDPHRTSPRLDPDPELGLTLIASLAGDRTEPPGTSTISFPGGTPDTSLPTTHTSSLCTVPLTPPDRCYLAPIPSVTDCPYIEPWPTDVALDRGKPRFPGSPLKVSISMDPPFIEPMVAPMVSPSPGHWSPVQIWTSTPRKNDYLVSDLSLSPLDQHAQSTMDASSVLANISHALVLRSRVSIQPYDDRSSSGTSSDMNVSLDCSPITETLQRADPARGSDRMRARRKNQAYPRFHYPDAYTCTWRRHGTRLPGKSERTAHTHAYLRSHSHMNLPASEWYDADAYTRSPVSVLSPPLCESATEDDDEDNIPLDRLRIRLAHRSAVVGLGFPIGVGIKTAAELTPRTRRMSEGCLLAASELTPTPVGVGTRASRNALSLALGDGHCSKDWLEGFSLRFSSDHKDAPTPALEPQRAVPSTEGVAAVGEGNA